MSLQAEWMGWPETQMLVAAFAVTPGSLRFVGGAVRDALLGRVVKDVDAATSLTPDVVMAVLAKAGIRAIPTGIAHGTVTALVGEKHFEITTLRKDVTTDGRHAEVAFSTDWCEDAQRRDFTFNAMYLSPEGELFDYFGGEADARAGRVRFIGDAGARIAEDYLRILRFFRFQAHYGEGVPDEDALHACAQGAARMRGLSGERVQAEILKLLAAKRASDTLVLMQTHGILEAAFSIGVDVGLFAKLEEVEEHLGMRMPAELKLAGFVWNEPAVLKVLSERLRLSGKVEKQLRTVLVPLHDVAPDMEVAAQKRLLRQMGPELFTTVVLLAWARDGHSDVMWRHMLEMAQGWQAPEFPVTGDDLIALGVAPGKAMGEKLKAMEEAWEQSDYRLEKPALLALVK